MIKYYVLMAPNISIRAKRVIIEGKNIEVYRMVDILKLLKVSYNSKICDVYGISPVTLESAAPTSRNNPPYLVWEDVVKLIFRVRKVPQDFKNQVNDLGREVLYSVEAVVSDPSKIVSTYLHAFPDAPVRIFWSNAVEYYCLKDILAAVGSKFPPYRAVKRYGINAYFYDSLKQDGIVHRKTLFVDDVEALRVLPNIISEHRGKIPPEFKLLKNHIANRVIFKDVSKFSREVYD